MLTAGDRQTIHCPHCGRIAASISVVIAKRDQQTLYSTSLASPINHHPWSVRVSNAFANFGKWNGKRFVLTPIATFADLCAATEFELKAQPNFGQKSLAEVKEALASYGLQLNPATYTDLCAATAEGMKDEASC